MEATRTIFTQDWETETYGSDITCHFNEYDKYCAKITELHFLQSDEKFSVDVFEIIEGTSWFMNDPLYSKPARCFEDAKAKAELFILKQIKK